MNPTANFVVTDVTGYSKIANAPTGSKGKFIQSEPNKLNGNNELNFNPTSPTGKLS